MESMVRLALALLVCSVGCDRGVKEVAEIQQRRQQRANTGNVDQVREAFEFVSTLAELDPASAQQRITGLLNAWVDGRTGHEAWKTPAMVQTLEGDVARFPLLGQLSAPRFIESDTDYLRLNYLLNQLASWVADNGVDDPLFGAWILQQESRLGTAGVEQLRVANRLFDWTIRNIALERREAEGPAPPAPPLPAGLEFRGPGYRQTTFQTLFRGTGDSLQRARVFMQLCRQANIDSCFLCIRQDDSPSLREWAVGVLVGKELFLFEPELGIPIPGAGQVGIATLEEARKDASIMRRLNVPGWFDYPWTSAQIQQTIAYIDVPVESLTWRMAELEKGLTGDLRMALAFPADAKSETFDAVPGVAGVRLWPVSIQSQIYEMAIAAEARSNAMLAVYEASRWGMLEGNFPLPRARWRHLEGKFDDEEERAGARVLYMQLLLPEADIENLMSNVDLQKAYNFRRELGMPQEVYEQRLRQVQYFMTSSKRTATYWISLMHFDTSGFDNARNWFEKRVLVEDRESIWKAAARYNLARTLEHRGEWEQAAELYKTSGDPQEHGNRIRARFAQRQLGETTTENEEPL